ncbi:VOC family protein [Chromohalobacter israelensis]|uniref:VOC family protein n=1 Tax=Chromohalobacter israelensis TaxID=141390 RepID=UPI000D714E2E|nr:VOC family protein [Chromohalobacter salexigens]PWW40062.1 catechol 2,3-dioxygenase-like lactoylglutathione lyase family enzyme [Chromohalobacter salexigens]
MLNAIDHVVVTVTDLELSIDFYTRVLGLDAHYHDATRTDLCLDGFALRLHGPETSAARPAESPVPGSQTLGFRSSLPLAEVKAHLEALAIPMELAPGATPDDIETWSSLYVRDPDGNLIEISRPRRR